MIEFESPEISRSNENPPRLPPYLDQMPDGKLMIVKEFAVAGARLGPYDEVVNYRTSQSPLRVQVPESERLKLSTSELTVLGFEQPEVLEAMTAITRLVNQQGRSATHADDRAEYKANLRVAYRAMARKAIEWVGKDRPLFLTPKTGGIYLQKEFEQVFLEMGLPEQDFFDFRMSRVLGINEDLLLGVTYGENNPDIADYDCFVICDDCMASRISTDRTAGIIRENRLKRGNIALPQTRVLITVSAGTQRGVESFLSPQVRAAFGFGQMQASIGIPVFEMNDHYYLVEPRSHPNSKYRQIVDDMGEWTR